MPRLALCAGLIVLLLSPTPVLAESANVKSAIRDLRRAMAGQQLDAGKAAVSKLLTENSADAAKALAPLVRQASAMGTDWYYLVIKGLAAFTSQEALQQVGITIVKHKKSAVGRDIVFWMQSNYSPYAAPVLVNLIDSTGPAIAFLALDHLGALRQKSSIAPLITMLERFAPKGRSPKPEAFRIIKALRLITMQDFGTGIDAWRAWWNGNKDKPLPARGDKPSTGTVADDMGGGREYGYGKLIKGEKGRILVISATMKRHNFDNIDQMLSRMQIPHTVVTKEEMNGGKVDLSNVVSIFINCTMFNEICICPTCKPGNPLKPRTGQCTGCDSHENYQDQLSNKSINNIVAWVKRGGYLFTEDWGLEEVLAVGFSRKVKVGYRIGKDEAVGIDPAPGMTAHSYLRRMFAKMLKAPVPQAEGGGGSVTTVPDQDQAVKIKYKWKIDKDSPTLKIVDKRGVQVLLTSDELAKKYQAQKVDRAVAITFAYGGQADKDGAAAPERLRGGRVLHVLSHFSKLTSGMRREDGQTMQNLLLNYLIEANERYLSRQSRKRK